jgi:hypothetical protein
MSGARFGGLSRASQMLGEAADGLRLPASGEPWTQLAMADVMRASGMRFPTHRRALMG